MKVRQLAPAEWSRALEQFTRAHRAWLVTVTRRAGAGEHDRPIKAPLLAVTTTGSDESPSLDVRLHSPDDPAHTIRLERVSAVRVHETTEGEPQIIEVDGASGEQLRLETRGAMPPDELLDGLAPGELLPPSVIDKRR